MFAAHAIKGVSGSAPSISLDLTSTLDGRITFTRSSSGTYYGSGGALATASTDVARFDHSGVSPYTAKGLLIEESRTNVQLYSDLSTTGWQTQSGQGSITNNFTTSPTGSSDATKFTAQNGAGTDTGIVYSGTSLSAGNYTFSAYAKKHDYQWVFLDIYDGANHRCWFDLTNGVVGTAAAGSTTAIVDVGGGWYRISQMRAFGALTVYPNLAISDADNSNASTGDGTKYNLWFGAQIELGDFASSYIATTSASATRAADVDAMTSTNFSSWWTAAQGTVAVTADSPCSGTNIVWQADDNTANNRITIYTSGTTVMCDVKSGGTTQASLNLGTATANTAFKVAIRYGTNDFAGCLNGGTVQTDTSGTVPTVDRCRFGEDTVVNYLNGHVSAFSAYTTGLSDSLLQSIST